MAGWKRICCAVDFSEMSRQAMHEASELARRFGAELTLLHVHEPPPALALDMLASPESLAEQSCAEIEQALAGWRAEAEQGAGRYVAMALRVGAPAAEIVQYARGHQSDLLVLGTHGRSGIERLVLGSVAERVIRHAPCAILVVRAQVAAGPHARRGWEAREAV
jgi:nucleotide-binding universal stress UspA family protein